MDNTLFKTENLTKEYDMGEVKVKALDSVSLVIPEGKLVVVLGPSGSGKSTLLNILGGMDSPSSGKLFFKDTEISAYNNSELTAFRRNNMGFVFQFYNLMPNLTAHENVELATEISKEPLDTMEVLELVGIKDRAGHFPSQMSGGEQQRVAIARAVAKNPDVLLCDEPTGALDYTTGVKILKLLSDINKRTGKSVIIITHNQPIADMADIVLKMRDGTVSSIHFNDNPLEPEKVVW